MANTPELRLNTQCLVRWGIRSWKDKDITWFAWQIMFPYLCLLFHKGDMEHVCVHTCDRLFHLGKMELEGYRRNMFGLTNNRFPNYLLSSHGCLHKCTSAWPANVKNTVTSLQLRYEVPTFCCTCSQDIKQNLSTRLPVCILIRNRVLSDRDHRQSQAHLRIQQISSLSLCSSLRTLLSGPRHTLLWWHHLNK